MSSSSEKELKQRERRDIILPALQFAVDQLKKAQQMIRDEPIIDFPPENLTVHIGTICQIEILTDGTLVFVPKGIDEGSSDDDAESLRKPDGQYIEAGPAGKRCSRCNGTGKDKT